jgi:hypothetical protein
MRFGWPSVLAVATALAVAVLVVAGDGGNDGSANASPSRAASTGCTKGEVVDRVQAFAEDLREASTPGLRRAWGDRMEWFSVTKTRGPNGDKKVWHFVAYKRVKALRWVEDREGLPLRISSVNVTDKERGHVGFAYEGRWASEWVVGKADMLCGSPQIRVWSMAIRDQPL